MDVLVAHNPTAGTGAISPERLRAWLSAAGHDVTYLSTDAEGWLDALRSAGEQGSCDLILAAGGDGTVHDVIVALAGTGAPIEVLPLGTANNVARALGVPLADPEAVVARVGDRPDRAEAPFDVAFLETRSRRRRFVESAGGGLMGEVLRRAAGRKAPGAAGPGVDEGRGALRDRRQALRDGRQALRDSLDAVPSAPWTVELDGCDRSGRYLGVEVMNVGSVGPAVPLAPDADPRDGLLDVVLVDDGDRDLLRRHLDAAAGGEAAGPPTLEVHRAARVELVPAPGVPVHCDDEHWCPSGERRLGIGVGGQGARVLGWPRSDVER